MALTWFRRNPPTHYTLPAEPKPYVSFGCGVAVFWLLAIAGALLIASPFVASGVFVAGALGLAILHVAQRLADMHFERMLAHRDQMAVLQRIAGYLEPPPPLTEVPAPVAPKLPDSLPGALFDEQVAASRIELPGPARPAPRKPPAPPVKARRVARCPKCQSLVDVETPGPDGRFHCESCRSSFRLKQPV